MRQQVRELAVETVLLAACAGLAIVITTVPASTPRIWAVLATMLTAPGWAILGFRPPRRSTLAWAAAIALSMSVVIIVALTMLVTHQWHPFPALIGTLAVSALLLAWHAVRNAIRLRRAPAAEAPAGEHATVDTVTEPHPGATAVPRGGRAAAFAAPLLLLVAAGLWLAGLRRIDPGELGPLGLAPRISWLCWIAYALLACGLVVELWGRVRSWVLLIGGLLEAVAMFGLQTMTYSAARLPVAWLHSGFAEQIATHGAGIPSFDARFSWPGFFSATGWLSLAAGYDSPEPMLKWAPVVLIALYGFATYNLARAIIGPGRGPWIAAFLAIAADWTEQEYFSPQATAAFLLVTALALFVHYLVESVDGRRPGLRAWRLRMPANSPADRIAAQVYLLIIICALAPTHQLTPFMLAGFFFTFLCFGRTSAGWLAVVALIVPTAWFDLGAQDYWTGQFSNLTSNAGNLSALFKSGIAGRVAGDPGHRVIVLLRMAITGVIGLAYVVAAWVEHRRGRSVALLVVLPLTTVILAVLQPYGGEIFMRCYLFALPWMVVLIGRWIADWSELPRWRRIVPAVTGLLLAGVMGACVVARGGNDAYVSLTESDVTATRYAVDAARPGDLVVAAWDYTTPLELDRVADVKQDAVTDLATKEEPCLTESDIYVCATKPDVAFVVLNPQTDNAGHILASLPHGWTARLQDRLVHEAGFTVVYDRDGRVVLKAPEGRS